MDDDYDDIARYETGSAGKTMIRFMRYNNYSVAWRDPEQGIVVCEERQCFALLRALAIFLMSEPFHTLDKARVSRVMWHEFTTSVFVNVARGMGCCCHLMARKRIAFFWACFVVLVFSNYFVCVINLYFFDRYLVVHCITRLLCSLSKTCNF